MDSEKLQASEKSVKSRAILARSAANGILTDQVLDKIKNSNAWKLIEIELFDFI